MVLQANYNVQYFRTIFCCFYVQLVFICLCSCFYVQLVFICLCSSYVNHFFLAIYVSSIISVVLAIDELMAKSTVAKKPTHIISVCLYDAISIL